MLAIHSELIRLKNNAGMLAIIVTCIFCVSTSQLKARNSGSRTEKVMNTAVYFLNLYNNFLTEAALLSCLITSISFFEYRRFVPAFSERLRYATGTFI